MEVDQKPVRKPGRWTAAFQIVICCGQLPTQTAIAAILLLLGVTPDVNGQIALGFFAAITLIDTVVVITLMHVFLADGNESTRRVFFGDRPWTREAGLGVVLTPVVLIGALSLVAVLKGFLPSLHNVPISPFESFLHPRWRALVFTVVAMVAGGVREELQRGFLLHRFEQSLGGMTVGLAVFSVAFGAFHYTQGWDVAIATGALGLFWGWLYMRRRSVVASMVSHAGFNGTQVLQQVLLRAMGQ